MTSSARNKKASGIASPIALAVLRLTTSTYVVETEPATTFRQFDDRPLCHVAFQRLTSLSFSWVAEIPEGRGLSDQRVRQRSTHRVRDFVFARFAARPVF